LLENKSENLTDYDQLKVLKFLAENQKITKKETKTLIGVKDTKAKEVLSQMVESGIIERIGQGRGMYYILRKKYDFFNKSICQVYFSPIIFNKNKILELIDNFLVCL
jgi:predicted transcriptional regulator of viral defense system